MKSLLSLFALSSIVIGNCFAMKIQDIDVFLLIGQSNMDGHAWTVKVDNPPVFLKQKHADILYSYQSYYGKKDWLMETWSPLQTMNGRFGPEISLGVSLLEVSHDSMIALIKSTRGGTNLHKDWDPNADQGLQLYQRAVDFTHSQIEKLIELGYTPRLRAAFWFQGEGDANKTEAIANAYEQSLKDFIAKLRADLEAPELPFVMARVYANRPGKHLYRDQVRAAFVNIADQDPDAAWIDVDDLVFPDDVHLDGNSYIEAGYRFAKAAQELID